MVSRRFYPATIVLSLAACATPQGTSLAEFEAALAAQESATAALEQWCASNSIAKPARIKANPVVGERHAVPSQVRELLKIAPGEAVSYRHVRLTCGDSVMSDAHNWFVPARLTHGMNETLAATNEPFGKVVSPLHFTRELMDSQRGKAAFCPGGTILSHRARLKLPDGSPISLVVECYTSANLRR